MESYSSFYLLLLLCKHLRFSSMVMLTGLPPSSFIILHRMFGRIHHCWRDIGSFSKLWFLSRKTRAVPTPSAEEEIVVHIDKA